MGMTEDILQETEEQQLRSYGHVMRMEDRRTAAQVTEQNSQGQKGRGRQYTERWDPR
jgi:hypothetical protein